MRDTYQSFTKIEKKQMVRGTIFIMSLLSLAYYLSFVLLPILLTK